MNIYIEQTSIFASGVLSDYLNVMGYVYSTLQNQLSASNVKINWPCISKIFNCNARNMLIHKVFYQAKLFLECLNGAIPLFGLNV